MIIPGMRDVEAADLEQLGVIVPEGEYTATIVECEAGASNGNEFIRFTFAIAGGPMAGRKIVDRVYFTERSIPIAKAKLAALSYSTDTERTFMPSDFNGRGLVIKVEHEQGVSKEGLPRVYANVTVWKKSGAVGSAPVVTQLPDDDIPF